MRKKQQEWDREWIRFVVSYRHGAPGKAARSVMYKKALYITGKTVCKPFRKK